MSKEKHTQSLTPKQEMFCQEYIIDFNGTRAAIAAGYSEKTATVTANETLRKPYIATRLQELMKAREERTEITQDMVVKELAKVAFINADQFYHDNGDVKYLSEMDTNTRAALSGYSIKTINIGDGMVEHIPVHKTHDKMKALELLGKHLGIFIDKQEITHNGNLQVYTPSKRDDN